MGSYSCTNNETLDQPAYNILRVRLKYSLFHYQISDMNHILHSKKLGIPQLDFVILHIFLCKSRFCDTL